MSPQFEVQPLSKGKRRLVFFLSFLIFVIAVPVSVFYATGYRFDFTDTLTSIKRVGGLYVRNDVSGTSMFVNDEPVTDVRVFQSAAYIQNLASGIHTVRVQGEGLETWVKKLPVYPHLVTEVTSFNLPKVPQVRLLTQLQNREGSGVIFVKTATSSLENVELTSTTFFSSTTATTSFIKNPEYTYISSLLASTTLRTSEQADTGVIRTALKKTFDVATSGAKLPVATTSKSFREQKLFERDGEVYVKFTGENNAIPYYYCLLYSDAESISAAYGEHVLSSLNVKYPTTTRSELAFQERVCRDTIRIDRLNQEVLWFDFLPGSSDHVLLQLSSGLYVIEIDDRGWQNTQRLYSGKELVVVVDGGRIFVKDGVNVFEVFTELVSSI